MADTAKRIQYQEIALNNQAMSVAGDIGFEVTNIYGRKIQQGDPGPDDHPVNSTISVAENTGGIGTFRHRGDEDRGNCWFSDCWLQTRDYLALPPDAVAPPPPAGEENSYARIHDKLGGYQYATYGKKLRRWNEATDAWDDPGGASTSTGTPSGPGVTWGDADTAKALYVPMGSGANYEKWTGAAPWVAGTEPAIAFAVWSQKLFKLDGNGAVKFTADGGTTWTLKGTIPNDETPKGFLHGYDRSQQPALLVRTSGRTYFLDFTNAELVETEFFYPDHPSGGAAGAYWRGSMYVSAGLGIQRWSGDLVSPFGPDGKDGLPEEFAQGQIVSMFPTYNELLVLISSGDLAFAPAVETQDAGISLPEQMYGQSSPKRALLLGQTGLGYHVKWSGEADPTNVAVSSTDGVYRAFWGTKGAIYTLQLPRGYYNPRYESTQVPLKRTCRHETPFYNWGFFTTPKILKQFEVKTEDCSSANKVTVWMRFSENDGWGNGESAGTPLAVLTTNPDSQHILNIGHKIIGDTEFHVGKEHEEVQFAFDVVGDAGDSFATPVIKWYSLVGRKWMRPVRVFSFQVDATMKKNGKSTRKIRDAILDAVVAKHAVPLVIGSDTYVVEVTSDDGNIEAALSEHGYVNLTCVEFTEIGTD